MQEKEKLIDVQDKMLNEARKRRIPVTIYTTNGFKMYGTLTGFDTYVVVMECGRQQKIVFKHAISTIEPDYMLEAGKVDPRNNQA